MFLFDKCAIIQAQKARFFRQDHFFLFFDVRCEIVLVYVAVYFNYFDIEA
jgi:hypothetical protein